jgi:hypothetical protein
MKSMKIVFQAVVIVLACLEIGLTYGTQSNGTTNSAGKAAGVCPIRACVPDEKTAVRIAEAVLIPVYGEKHIMSERPFTARLQGDRWVVKGSLGTSRKSNLVIFGGTAMTEISKQDGRILAVYHLK